MPVLLLEVLEGTRNMGDNAKHHTATTKMILHYDRQSYHPLNLDRSPYMGKTTAVATAITTSTVCSIFMTPDNGTAARAWDFSHVCRCWCMQLHKACTKALHGKWTPGQKSLATSRSQTCVSTVPGLLMLLITFIQCFSPLLSGLIAFACHSIRVTSLLMLRVHF